MELHLLRGDLDFHWLQPADGQNWDCRGGTPVRMPWRVPQLVLPDGEREVDFLPVDCLAMNTGCDGPILSDYAREVLDGVLDQAGELWPVTVLGQRYWWFNCLSMIDALDSEGTEADWGSVGADGEEFRWILSPQRLAFLPGKVAKAPAVFRVPEFPHGALFADERLKQAISRSKLTGFRMDPVWSLDTGGVRDPAGFSFSDAWVQPRGSAIRRKRALARATLQDRTPQPN